MTHSFEERIRERAYHLWQSGGMAHGTAHDHWIHAEQAVMSERKPVKAAKASVAKTAAKATKPSSAKAVRSKDLPMTAALTKKTPAATARALNTLN